MLKKVLVAMILGISVVSVSGVFNTYLPTSSVAEAANPEKMLQGEWYDSDGNLVVTVANGYFNGCQILGFRDLVGGAPIGGYIQIQESAGVRELYMVWSGRYYEDGWHEAFLEINHGETLHH